MRDAHLVNYLYRAVLIALALPAAGCGSHVGVGTLVPPASCDWAPSPVGMCNWSFTFTGLPSTCVGFAGTGTPDECLAICATGAAGDAPTSCSVFGPSTMGIETLECFVANTANCRAFPPGNGGRRPAYFASLGFGVAARGREVGAHFGRAACMEAGSVEAFRALRDELVAHRAPRRLVRAASRAMRDEVRHVRQTAALARRFGEEPLASIPPPKRPVRSLEAIARENAVEGCVRETFSALECAWQAKMSVDPAVRATMARIARDEMRHVTLSWAVHRWAVSRLDRGGREAIRAAQRQEVDALAGEVAVDPAEALVRVAGLPRAQQARALIDAIAACC